MNNKNTLNNSQYYNYKNICTVCRFEDIEINNSLNYSLNSSCWSILNRKGKKWRIILSYLICLSLGNRFKITEENAINLLYVAEVIHNTTLIIDDILDNSYLRRGKPSIHILFGKELTLFTSNTLVFAPVRYYLNHILPNDIIVKNKDNNYFNEIYKDISSSYIDELSSILIGEMIDTEISKSRIPKINSVYDILLCKTGSMIRLYLKFMFGVINFNGIETDKKHIIQTKLIKAIEYLSISFQIKDDLLNIKFNGISANKGYVGEDIYEGKKSLMILHALNQGLNHKKLECFDSYNYSVIELLEGDSKRLYEILSMKTTEAKYIEESIEILYKLGSINFAENKQKEYYECFIDCIKELSNLVPNKEYLLEIIELTNFMFFNR